MGLEIAQVNPAVFPIHSGCCAVAYGDRKQICGGNFWQIRICLNIQTQSSNTVVLYLLWDYTHMSIAPATVQPQIFAGMFLIP